MAAQRRARPDSFFVIDGDEPIIAIPGVDGDGRTVTYFTSVQAADAATSDEMVQAALSLAGAWSDLSWEEAEAALHQIRHESEPSPPLIDSYRKPSPPAS